VLNREFLGIETVFVGDRLARIAGSHFASSSISKNLNLPTNPNALKCGIISAAVSITALYF